MKAKDLIKILEKNPELDIRIKYTDRCDWIREQYLSEEDVSIEYVEPNEDELNSAEDENDYDMEAFILTMYLD